MNKISVKLFTSYMLIVIVMVVSSLIGMHFLSSAENIANNLYDHYGIVQAEAAMALTDFNEVKVNIRNILYLYEKDTDKHEELIEKIEGFKTDIADYLAGVEAVPLSEDCANYLSEAKADVEEYLEDVDDSIAYVRSGDMKAAQDYFMENGVASANVARENLINMMASLNTYATEMKEDMHSQNLINYAIMGVMMAAAVIIACVIASIMTAVVEKPVHMLTEASRKIAEGDTDVVIEKTSRDEIGTMLESVSNMVENIRKQETIVNDIARGDLRVQVELRSEKDSMNAAIKRMVADNNRVLHDISTAAWEINNGSGQISMASQSLAQGATEQASAIEEISASVKDISGKSESTAEQTKEARQLVEEARESAVSGNQEMQEMVMAMNNINESSENISRIIKVIDDIAFQTNILALNAAVEAQRAGVHGKGFAVVAEEVRNLAAKSASASKETAELIEDTMKKVKEGSGIAANTETALKDIMDKIDRIVEEIQASEASQIDKALTQVADVVQTNSATSEECAAACQQLSEQAENLKGLLTHYRLAE